MGEFFVKATTRGLNKLASVIETNRSEQMVKELSCIEAIEPVTPAFRTRGKTALDILKHSPRSTSGFVTRVRLFDFGAYDGTQETAVASFEAACSQIGAKTSTLGYSTSSYTYSVECRSVEQVDSLSRMIGVRSIAQMPLLRSLRPTALNPQPIPPQLPIASPNDDLPVVVVVDTGISDTLPALNSFVAGRISDVAPQYQNTSHGTFVAGLICWGAELNPNLKGLDASPCAVFDLQVLPNADPTHGEIDTLTEAEFLQSLETALVQNANRFKVWNLSLSSNEVCSLDEFSALAEQLDNLQEKYKVSFVISAGNYETVPLLDYPRSGTQEAGGRITSPADSVLGITVGAISHLDYATKGPKIDHPSPFSRHGAGPNYIIKPDLVHYGGTCATDLSHRGGVRSVQGSSSAEDIGTSFSTPLVSRTLAQIYHQITPTPSQVLARALLTHHARDPRTGGRVPDGEENYLGFGLPAAAPRCLECTPSSSTLIFDDVLRRGYFLEWDDFPYPQSLKRNGKYFGEVWMTVAFAPTRGARWGAEYCETHIDAHFGVYANRVSRTTGEVTETFKGLVPPEHKNPGQLYESFQVKELRKWAPVRTYHGRLNLKGERGNRWRLMVKLLTRHGIEAEEGFRPQPFSLVITIADPEGKAPVYDEMARTVRTRFQAENLAVRSALRVQNQG